MRAHVSDGQVLQAVKAIEATFYRSKWMELGLPTDTLEYMRGHGRLLRSLSLGDEDGGLRPTLDGAVLRHRLIGRERLARRRGRVRFSPRCQGVTVALPRFGGPISTTARGSD